MRTKLAATCLLIGALIAPLAGYAADTEKVLSSSKELVKDSVITTKIKAKLAEEKLSSAVHIKVITDDKGAVRLSGTAKSQEEVDKAGSIARGVEGVTSVENSIEIAKAKNSMGAVKSSNEERAESRIKDMHAKLKITAAQEEQWSKVAQMMRDNAKQMDTLTKTRAEKANMNAIDDLKSYGEITDAHADGIKRFTPVFETLYNSMSDAQKKDADELFRHRGSMQSKHAAKARFQ